MFPQFIPFQEMYKSGRFFFPFSLHFGALRNTHPNTKITVAPQVNTIDACRQSGAVSDRYDFVDPVTIEV